MHSLKTKVTKLEAAKREQLIIVIVQRGETHDEAFARMGIDPASLHPKTKVIIVDRQGAQGTNRRMPAAGRRSCLRTD